MVPVVRNSLLIAGTFLMAALVLRLFGPEARYPDGYPSRDILIWGVTLALLAVALYWVLWRMGRRRS